MRKNGIDPKELSARLESMPASERKKIWANYGLWIAAGAKAQGWLGYIGAMAIGLSAFIPVIAAVNQVGTLLIYSACAFAAGFGFFLFRIGARREREWRKSNPFKY